MKRINNRKVFIKSIAGLLAAVMTVSIVMSYDQAGQFLNSIKTAFADEIEYEYMSQYSWAAYSIFKKIT